MVRLRTRFRRRIRRPPAEIPAECLFPAAKKESSSRKTGEIEEDGVNPRREVRQGSGDDGMNHQEATIIIKAMEGNVPFFPRDEAAQAMIADELVSMGATVPQGMWLGRRYAQLYTKEWK